MRGTSPATTHTAMNTHRLTQARRLFVIPDVPASTARHNMRAWVRSVRQLGNRWLIAKPINVGTAQ